jgi:peptide/nickel transport system substrate-binding protein
MWAEQDFDAARQIMLDAGVPEDAFPIPVRFLYGASNVRRANQFALFQAAGQQSGLFDLIDEGDDAWGQRLGDGTYDVSLFGWQSTSTALNNSEANFISGGNNNHGGMSNAEVDALWAEISSEFDEQRAHELVAQMERVLNEEGFGGLLFQFPEVLAVRDNVQGVSTISLAPTLFWNFWNWNVVSD